MNEPHGIHIERFPAELHDGVPSARISDFNVAMSRGFHERALEAEALATLAGIQASDSSTLTAAYDHAADARSLHAGKPVATYASFPGTLNVGGGVLLPAHQITSVTVSPTHRRRGILRSMITEDLAAARAAGMPLAVLTASEATIYGRFGFGVVAERVRFALKTDRGVALRTPGTGSVIAIDPAELDALAPGLFAASHARTLGSVSHNTFDVGNAAGRWEDFDALEPIKNLRAALHLDSAGVVDGFMTYEFSGWKAKTSSMSIGQMGTLNGAARRALVAYLGEHDLIEEVTGRGPMDDVIPLALHNARDYKITRAGDHLWMRILDIETVLAARPYHRDGRISLGVRDDLQLANGAWELVVENSVPTIRRAPAESAVDASLDVRDLATLVMGTRSAATLSEAGVLTAHTTEALSTLDALFATDSIPYCQADF